MRCGCAASNPCWRGWPRTIAPASCAGSRRSWRLRWRWPSDDARAPFARPRCAARDGRLTHIFVDEFQDTDPLQAEIVLLLSASDPAVSRWQDVTPAPGKLFLVGDPKQSIYRFRRADVGTYQAVKELLVSRGAARVYLTTSFRAIPSIQNLVNAAFAPVMTDDRAALQAGYVPVGRQRENVAGQPGIVALPVPKPYGHWGGFAKISVEASLPDAVGAFVAWLLNESGWEGAQ